MECSKRILTDKFIADRYKKAVELLQLMDKKLPEYSITTSFSIRESQAKAWYKIAEATGNNNYRQQGNAIMSQLIDRYTQYMRYYYSLDTSLLNGLTSEDEYMFNQAGYLCLFKTFTEGDEAAAKKKFEQVKKTCKFDIFDGLRRAAYMTQNGSRQALYNLYDSYATLYTIAPKELEDYTSKNKQLQTVIISILDRLNGED